MNLGLRSRDTLAKKICATLAKKDVPFEGSSFQDFFPWLKVAEIQISVFSQTLLETSLCFFGPDIFSEGLPLPEFFLTTASSPQTADFDVGTRRMLMDHISWKVMAETNLTRFLKAGPCLVGGNAVSFGYLFVGGCIGSIMAVSGYFGCFFPKTRDSTEFHH